MVSLLESDAAPTRDRLSQTRQFKDGVHDYGAKHFQRLRYIKQLGLTYYVFPGASHNRFEHCLGVCHLARLMAVHLRDTQSSLGITDQHRVNGPWSHVWDNIFIPTALPAKKAWIHEQASDMMFDDMVETYQLDITPEEVTIVKALIAGDKNRCVLGQTMPFLFEIVANQRNGLDVDKFDYILRDCQAVGDKGNSSLSRWAKIFLLGPCPSARVIDGMIWYGIKDANQIYELCYTRFSFHKRIYNHKTRELLSKAIEYMVIDALLEAEPYLKTADHVDKPKSYVFLTDNPLNGIEESTEKELEGARAIIERLRTRDLYKVVDFKVFSHEDKKMIKENITPEKIVGVANQLLDVALWQEEKNPLDEVAFYGKGNPDRCGKADYSDISLLMPSSFAEVSMRVYTKDGTFYRHILKNLPATGPIEELWTPPPSDSPLKPREFSRNLSAALIGETSFFGNQFTAVPPNFRGESPSKRPRNKRGRDVSDTVEGMRPRKSIRLSEQATAAP
ncbi:hypothetical protein PAXINDRAFT_160479 [Paxillus involutus ATCC 200175]|nr:hypothetical protein PAXINDRAFT_160479 [Paxillus involutus ATCC 200175]